MSQRHRIVHEIEQVVEPAARIGRRPTVKLGLHPRYPPIGLFRVFDKRGTVVQRCVFRHCSLLPFSIPLPSFPMYAPFARSEYYGGSAPFRPDRPTMNPALSPERIPGRGREPERFPCSLQLARRSRSPALSLRPRHGYPAALHRGLPTGMSKPVQKFPAPVTRFEDAPHPAHICTGLSRRGVERRRR